MAERRLEVVKLKQLTTRQQEVKDTAYKLQNYVLLAHVIKYEEGTVSWEEAMTDAACSLASAVGNIQDRLIKSSVNSYHRHDEVNFAGCKLSTAS